MQKRILVIPGKKVVSSSTNEKTGIARVIDARGKKSFISFPNNQKSWFTLKLDGSFDE